MNNMSELREYLSGIEVIVFDAYGTLLDTADGSVHATAQILELRRSSLDPQAVYKKWKIYHRRIIAGLVQFRPEREIFVESLAAINRKYQIEGNPKVDVEYMFASFQQRRPFVDAVPAIRALRSYYRLFIASNSDQGPLAAHVYQFGLDVEECYSSESLQCYKPDPTFYHRLLEKLAVSPSSVLFVGDSLKEDVSGPCKAGMRAVLLDRKGKSCDSRRDCHVIESLVELCRVLVPAS